MRFHAAFAFLIAGLCTFSGAEANVITDQIASSIKEVQQTIKDLGLDPLLIKLEEGSYALPVPVIFSAKGIVEALEIYGLSDIRITHINYDVLRFVLNIDLEMPLVNANLGNAAGDVTVFGNNVDGEASGLLEIGNVQFRGVFYVSILGGINIRDIDVDFSIGQIKCQFTIIVLGIDISSYVNNFVENIIPQYLTDFEDEINELIAIVLRDQINARLFD